MSSRKRKVADSESAIAGPSRKYGKLGSPTDKDVVEIPDEKPLFFRWIWTDKLETYVEKKANVTVAVIVKNIPMDSSLNELQWHFNSRSNGGCGDVKYVSWEPTGSDCDSKTARVTFGLESSVQSVLSFPHFIKETKLDLKAVDYENFVPPSDPTPLASKTELAKWRSELPKLQLPPKLSHQADVGYLDVEMSVGKDPEEIFRAEGGDPDDQLMFKPDGGYSDHSLLAKNRSEPDLIGHIAQMSHKLTNLSGHVTQAYLLLRPKGKNIRKKLNADEAKELERLKEILKVDVIDTLNSSISRLHQTTKRLTNKLARSERIRVELRNQTVAKQKKLELSEAEVILLNQNLSESQSDCKLARENEKSCQAEIVQLHLVISQLLESAAEDQTESERIRTELSEKLVTRQQEFIQQLNKSQPGRVQLQSDLKVAEEKLERSGSLITSLEQEVAELKNANRLDKANLAEQLDKFGRLKVERDQLQFDLQLATEKLKQSDAQVASLQREIDERSRTVATSELSREALRAQNLELMKKVNQMDQLLIESDRLNEHVVKITSELKCAQDKITSLEDEIVRLNQRLSESQDALKLSQESCESSQKRIASLEAEVKELRTARLSPTDMDEFVETQADPSLDQENFDNIASLQEPIVVQRELNVSPTDLVESDTDYQEELQPGQSTDKQQSAANVIKTPEKKTWKSHTRKTDRSDNPHHHYRGIRDKQYVDENRILKDTKRRKFQADRRKNPQIAPCSPIEP